MSEEMTGLALAVVLSLIAAGFFVTAWLSYTGRFRSWTLTRPPLTMTGKYWGLLPMALAGAGIMFVAVFGGLTVAAGGSSSAPPLWGVVMVVGLAACIVAAIWTSHRLPRTLKPGWYRDWEDRGVSEHDVTDWLAERQRARRMR
ncbi:MAG: hypothetical protein QJR09_00870 [Micrococcus sp.]|nr:hypothetical protein [Micrococcus sp.]